MRATIAKWLPLHPMPARQLQEGWRHEKGMKKFEDHCILRNPLFLQTIFHSYPRIPDVLFLMQFVHIRSKYHCIIWPLLSVHWISAFVYYLYPIFSLWRLAFVMNDIKLNLAIIKTYRYPPGSVPGLPTTTNTELGIQGNPISMAGPHLLMLFRCLRGKVFVFLNANCISHLCATIWNKYVNINSNLLNKNEYISWSR